MELIRHQAKGASDLQRSVLSRCQRSNQGRNHDPIRLCPKGNFRIMIGQGVIHA